jgi:ketosteroid isomerase-like protein
VPLSVEDHIAIEQLYVAYNHRIDFGTAEEWAACFTDDATFNSGYSEEVGHDALLAFFAATKEMVPDIRHIITNVLIEGDGDTACGSAYIEATTGAGGDRTALTTGRYQDELVKTADGWRFSVRKMLPDG